MQADQVIERYATPQFATSAPPTGRAGLLGTGWSVHLLLDRRAIDISASASITVLAPPAGASGMIAAGGRGDSAAVCAVSPQIEARDLHAGSVHQRSVSILARQPAETRGTRIGLIRVETSVSPHRTDPTRDCHDTDSVVS